MSHQTTMNGNSQPHSTARRSYTTATTIGPDADADADASANTNAHEGVETSLLPPAPHYRPKGSLPNTPLSASLISALLGGIALSCLTLALRPSLEWAGCGSWSWARSRLGLYGFAWGLFHLCEFWTTAGWNPLKLSVDAFLLNNTNQYHLAHLGGLTEYFVSSYFFPHKFDTWISSPLYLLIDRPCQVCGVLFFAQTIRSLAMIHANVSFSHVVKNIKHEDHVLVTHGVYSILRHPSYFGFFYWAIATQLLLGNIGSTLAFIVILGRFFSARIKDEEKHLVRFFGDEYVQYRKRVGTGLPFMT